MAFRIVDGVGQEMRAAFCREEHNVSKCQAELNQLFRKHGNLTMKHLKRKWNIISMEAYIEAKLIPQGLRERVIPAEHLHNDRFLKIWTEEWIKHGLHSIGLIIEEEKIQLQKLKEKLQESIKILGGYQDLEQFEKFNEWLKREVEEFQKEQRIGKQKKFQRDAMDFESGKILDLEKKRGRSRSCSKFRKQSREKRDQSLDANKSVTFLETSLDGSDREDPGGHIGERGNKKGIEKGKGAQIQGQRQSRMGNSTSWENRITTQNQKKRDLNVINLTEHALGQDHLSLLSKGLGFSQVIEVMYLKYIKTCVCFYDVLTLTINI